MLVRLISALVLMLLAPVGVARTRELSPAQLAWLKKNAIEVKTVEAGNGFGDLQPLKDAIGAARIISLGEATHGTREIFQMKHRLTEFLASEMDFTIFSIEANMPEAYRVNDYVLHGKGDPKALLRGMYFWTWDTEEVLEMIEWMRRFNASGKGRIEFTGFDMQNPSVAAEIVRDFLAKAGSAYATTVANVYRDIGNVKRTGSFGVATATFPVRAAAGKKIKFSGAIKTKDVGQFAGLWWRADGPKGVLAFDNMQDRGPKGTTDWKRYAVVLEVPAETVNINFGVLMPGMGTAWFDDLQVEIDGQPFDPAGHFDLDFESGETKGFFTSPAGYRVRVEDTAASRGTRSLMIESEARAEPATQPESPAVAARKCGEVVAHLEMTRGEYLKRTSAQEVDWAIQNARVVQQFAQMTAGEVSRDESMARNVKWIVDRAPKSTRIVLWAHNGHVGKIQDGSYRAMGAYLDDWYGKDHVPVGFAVNRGEYTAVTRGKGLGQHRLAAPGPGSYELAFARAGMPRFMLDLRRARPGDDTSGWLHTPMTLRSIGAVAMDQQFHATNLGKAFDLLVYLEETTPTRTLPR